MQGRASPPDSAGTSTGLRRFAGAMRELASRQSVDETLQLVVDLSTELVRGCDLADIMFIRAGGMSTPVSTDPLAIALDDAQEQAEEGPCLAAGREEVMVVTDDLATDQRWPTFGPRAASMGVRSALSYQLFLHRNDEDRFGALNLYGEQPAAFDDTSVELGEVLAALCSATLATAIEVEGLRSALASRDVIGQAKGILMQRHRISASEAFDLLAKTSQARNVKVREIAARLVETGALD
jgi:hypothetical protein